MAIWGRSLVGRPLVLLCIALLLALCHTSHTSDTSSPGSRIRGTATGAEGAGRQWYVSPSGSDSGSGSANDPLGSIAEAAVRATPGDVVHLLPGTYNIEEDSLFDNIVVGGSGAVNGPRDVTLNFDTAQAGTLTFAGCGGLENVTAAGMDYGHAVRVSGCGFVRDAVLRDSRGSSSVPVLSGTVPGSGGHILVERVLFSHCGRAMNFWRQDSNTGTDTDTVTSFDTDTVTEGTRGMTPRKRARGRGGEPRIGAAAAEAASVVEVRDVRLDTITEEVLAVSDVPSIVVEGLEAQAVGTCLALDTVQSSSSEGAQLSMQNMWCEATRDAIHVSRAFYPQQWYFSNVKLSGAPPQEVLPLLHVLRPAVSPAAAAAATSTPFIRLYNVELVAEHCEFAKPALDGPIVELSSANLTLSDSIVGGQHRDTACRTALGGAILATGLSVVVLQHSTVSECSAHDGGVLYCADALPQVFVSHSLLSHNSAASGALFECAQAAPCHVQVIDTILLDNVSPLSPNGTDSRCDVEYKS